MKFVTGTWFARALELLAGVVFRYAKLILWSELALAVVCVWYTAFSPWHLQFDTSRDNLVGANKRYHRNFLRFKQEFPEQDDLVVVVESENTDKNRQFVERLGARLEAETNLFKDVFYKGDLKLMGNKALLFVPEKDLEELRQTLQTFRPFITQFTKATNLVSLFSLVNAQFGAAKREANAENASLVKALPALERIVREAEVSLRLQGAPPSPGISALFGAGEEAEQQAYLTFEHSPLLKASDILDAIGLIRQLRDPAQAAARHLFAQFSPDAQKALAAYRSEREPSAAARVTLLAELNRLLQGPSLFDEKRFAGLPMDEETRQLLATQPKEAKLARLNRSLLEAVFPPSMISRLPKTAPIYLVNAHAPAADLNQPAVERLRQLVERTQQEVPGLNVGITGEPVLEHDEMQQSQRDTTVASVVSLILCALIFIYGYNETGRPIKATFCLLVGIAYTLGFATLVIGHLNILTITFVPILIGLAIDFGVHLITRYEEDLRRGRPPHEAMLKAIVFTGQGILTGGFTTAGAFLAMGLTDFKGIQEMGIICGGGLLVCLVPMMTLLPVLLLRGRQNVIDHAQGDPFAKRARIESLWLERPVLVGVVTLALCGLAAAQFRKVGFDYNLLNMQSKGLPAVVYEQKLIESAGKSVLFGAVLADSLEEAKALEERIKKLPAVSGVESMSAYLTEDQTRKLQLIGEIKQEVAPIRFADFDREPVRVEDLSTTLYILRGYCEWADEAAKDDPEVARQLRSLGDAIGQFRKRLLAQPEVAAEKVAAFQRALFQDVRDTFQALAHQDNRERLRVADLPAALRNRFVGRTGQHLLQVYPKQDVWKRENQKEFIRELREALTPDDVEPPTRIGLNNRLKRLVERLTGIHATEAPDLPVKPIITGTPVQLYEYTGLLVNSYVEAACYSLGAIVILVFLHFRTATAVGLALLPVAVGSIFLGGIMGGFGIPLNPANIMTLPLVIGIGVTNGIHILNRFAEEKVPAILAKSTGKAVLVSGLTSVAGFGSLVLGKHQGIQSLGWVMAAGIATCMVAGLTFLPAVMGLATRRGAGTKQPSADNARSTLGREEPRQKPRVSGGK
jgi:hypothetical protein